MVRLYFGFLANTTLSYYVVSLFCLSGKMISATRSLTSVPRSELLSASLFISVDNMVICYFPDFIRCKGSQNVKHGVHNRNLSRILRGSEMLAK